MGVTYKTVKNQFPSMIAQMEAMDGRKVKVGALSGGHAWLAGIHEYGCTIPVTDKMRAYLHSQGLHLKQSTKVIKIPERSFLRNGFDENNKKILNHTDLLIRQVLSGKMSVDTMLDSCGKDFAGAIKEYLIDLSKPANHPFTIEQKRGKSNPLVNTGSLSESITWKTE